MYENGTYRYRYEKVTYEKLKKRIDFLFRPLALVQPAPLNYRVTEAIFKPVLK